MPQSLISPRANVKLAAGSPYEKKLKHRGLRTPTRYSSRSRHFSGRFCAVFAPFGLLRCRCAVPNKLRRSDTCETSAPQRSYAGDTDRRQSRDGKNRKQLLHGPMHHWCGSARCACGPLRLRRARFARNERWVRGKRALRRGTCRPAPARRGIQRPILSSNRASELQGRPPAALDGVRAPKRLRAACCQPCVLSGLPAARRQAGFQAPGSPLTPRIGADYARRDADFPFASRCASVVTPASDTTPPRGKLRQASSDSALGALAKILIQRNKEHPDARPEYSRIRR